MDVQIKIDPSATVPYLEIHTAAVTPEITALINRIAAEPSSVMLPGFRGEEVIPLYPSQLIRIYDGLCFYCFAKTVLIAAPSRGAWPKK